MNYRGKKITIFKCVPKTSAHSLILDPDPQGSRGAAGMIYSEMEGKSVEFLIFTPPLVVGGQINKGG